MLTKGLQAHADRMVVSRRSSIDVPAPGDPDGGEGGSREPDIAIAALHGSSEGDNG
jgi:hypothetical protein